MSPTSKLGRGRRLVIWTFLLLAIGILLLVLLFIGQSISGADFGIQYLPRYIVNVMKAVRDQRTIHAPPQAEFTNIFFLHHSTGENLILQGRLRERLTSGGYRLWDHGYNHQGLRDPEGHSTGYSYNIPGDNTDPLGLEVIFNQPFYPLPVNALSAILQHDVIVMKSCFLPTSKITTPRQLDAYKDAYRDLREKIWEHPDKIFILLTQPPLNPAETNPEEAARAKNLAGWLASPEYAGSSRNLFVFDLFSALAENEPGDPNVNMLRQEYRWGEDSHPNETANQAIAPLLADFMLEAVREYQSSHE